MKRLWALLLAALTLGGCGAAVEAPTETTAGEVFSLPQAFILGMDASCVPALEAGGVVYRDFEGQAQDVFQTLAENGITHIRVRIWNDPYDEQGHGYGGGNCDLANAIAIGRRATQYGMQLLVNFHYSDFWADPGKQMVPKAWAGMSLQEKADALYAYTLDSLNELKQAGVAVGMVQVGNETNNALCGETDWDAIALLMGAGVRAVREALPQAQVALHFANPEKSGSYAWYAQQLQDRGVDYDVFASSYYPYWHGSLENLSRVLEGINKQFGKQVMVMETSYAYTGTDSDHYANTVSAPTGNCPYPFSVEGQGAHIRAVTETVAAIPGGMGVVYWEGTWITAGGSSREENSQSWERFGTGWAASFAAGYDPDDAGKYYGGCAVDNQALFDAGGKPLASLQIFKQLHESRKLP